MADVTVTPTRIAPGTKGTAHDGGSSITTGQTFKINGADLPGLVLELYDSGGSAAVWTFDAGAYPPSARKGLGAVTATPTASKSHIFVPERGRHLQTDGSITGSVLGGTAKLLAYYMPLGDGG